MRILLTTDSYFPVISGVTTVVHHLGIELEKQGHVVTILAPVKLSTDKNISSPPILGISAFRNPIRPDHYIAIPSYKNVEQKILTFAPNVIHAHTPGPIGSLVAHIAQKKHIPMIASCHGVPGYVTSYFPKIPKPILTSFESLLWKYSRRFFNSVQHVVAPSEFIQEVLKKHGVTKPTTEIPMWIELPTLKLHTDKKIIRERWHIPTDAYVFLYFGRLDYDKNLLTLVSAFTRLQKQTPIGTNPHLLIVGRGRQGKKLEAYIHKHNIANVRVEQVFLEQKRVEEIYKLSDAFVMPGPFEAQSIVTLQAIAHNLQVILAHDGALPEIAGRFADRSYLFQTPDPDDLARVMKTCMKNPPPKSTARATLKKYYSKSGVLSAYNSLYTSLSPKPFF